MASLSNSQAKEKDSKKEQITSIDNYTFGKEKNFPKYNYQFDDHDEDKEERVKPLYLNSNKMNLNKSGKIGKNEENFHNLKNYIQHRRISSKQHTEGYKYYLFRDV